jgi:hypothetical protein
LLLSTEASIPTALGPVSPSIYRISLLDVLGRLDLHHVPDGDSPLVYFVNLDPVQDARYVVLCSILLIIILLTHFPVALSFSILTFPARPGFGTFFHFSPSFLFL